MEKAFIKALEAAEIEFVRILWCDNANIIRAKAVHRNVLESHIPHGVGISCGQQGVPAMFDIISPGSGLGPVGEVRLVPDWSTFTPLPYSPLHARVMGDMMQHGKPWPLCPRNFLRNVEQEALKEGIEILTAFENEFYLLQPDAEGITPADSTLFAMTASMDRHHEIITDMVDALMTQGMTVEQYYPESGPGEQEITIQPASPLEAANNQIAFRETVNAVAQKAGLQATFLPKVFMDQAGAGCHLHMSLWKSGQNLIVEKKGRQGLSAVARSFIAGILEHVQALMAITTPTVNSFRRIKPCTWSGAFRCWGFDNREAAVRVLTDPLTGEPTHFEFKVLDATANPYLALGSIIAAGLDGVRRKLDPGKPVESDPGKMSAKERKSLKIEPLPTQLSDVLGFLEKDEVLVSAMGKGLAEAYLAVKRLELEHTSDLKLSDEIDLLADRY